MAALRRDLDGQYPISIQEFKEAYPNTSFPAQIDFTEYGHHVVFDAPRPITNQLQVAAEGVPFFDDVRQIWIQTWVVNDLIADLSEDQITDVTVQMRADKCRDLAAFRYARETSGILLSGQQIATDRDSQNNISNAVTCISLNPTATIQWCMPDGNWVTLNFDQIKQLASAVFTHVQSCRSFEKSLSDQIIAAATPQAILDIDITANWPSNSY